MQKTGKKLLSLIIAVVFCTTTFAVTGVSADKAYAEGYENPIPTDFNMIYYPNWKYGNTKDIAADTDISIDMDSVESTDPEVASLVYEPGQGDYPGYYLVKANKPGTAKLSFFAAPPGAAVAGYMEVNVTVYKWLKPCTTFKVGSTSYVKKFNNKYYYGSSKKVSGKLYIKARSGWKITYIGKYINSKGKLVRIKNKSKVTLKKNDQIHVQFRKKGTDRYELVLLYRY